MSFALLTHRFPWGWWKKASKNWFLSKRRLSKHSAEFYTLWGHSLSLNLSKSSAWLLMLQCKEIDNQFITCNTSTVHTDSPWTTIGTKLTSFPQHNPKYASIRNRCIAFQVYKCSLPLLDFSWTSWRGKWVPHQKRPQKLKQRSILTPFIPLHLYHLSEKKQGASIHPN